MKFDYYCENCDEYYSFTKEEYLNFDETCPECSEEMIYLEDK